MNVEKDTTLSGWIGLPDSVSKRYRWLKNRDDRPAKGADAAVDREIRDEI